MPRRADACAACGRLFEIGELFQACLYEAAARSVRPSESGPAGGTESAATIPSAPASAPEAGPEPQSAATGGYFRCDFCGACAPPAQPVPIARWKTRRPAPAVRKTAVFDRASVTTLFERLGDARTAQEIQLRFVLALLLWRKRVLKLERTLALDDRELEVWEFSMVRGGALHRVPRPTLGEDELEQLSLQLEQLLAGDGAAEPATRLPSAAEPPDSAAQRRSGQATEESHAEPTGCPGDSCKS